MRFEVFEAILFELDWLLQKPSVATGFKVQSRHQVFKWREVRSTVIPENAPSNTLTRSLLGLKTEILGFIQLVM